VTSKIYIIYNSYEINCKGFLNLYWEGRTEIYKGGEGNNLDLKSICLGQ